MEILVTRLKRTGSYLKGEDWNYNIDNTWKNEFNGLTPNEKRCISENKFPRIEELIGNHDGIILNENKFKRRNIRFSTLTFNNIKGGRISNLNVRHSGNIEKDLDIPFDFVNSPKHNQNSIPNTIFSLPDKDVVNSPIKNFIISEESKRSPQFSSYGEVSEIEDCRKFDEQDLQWIQQRPSNKKLSLSCEEITYIEFEDCSPIKNKENLNKSLDNIHYYQRNSETNNEEIELSIIQDRSPKKNMMKSMKSSLIEKIDVFLLNFEEALSEFHSFSYVYTEKNIWVRPWHRFISSCCIPKCELAEKHQEICEKFIIFSYSVFLQYDVYHKNLLATVSYILRSRIENSEKWSDIGFSNNNPLTNDLTHHTAVGGLLFIIFIDKYFPLTLTEILLYSLQIGNAFIPLAFDIGEMVIISLRKGKFNQMFLASEKCLEIIFFLYAGCIGYWFSLHKDNPKPPGTINILCENLLNKSPNFFISLAKQLLKKQNPD